ncbi:TIGR02594 family protein [uncultured Sphingorhabdus sp.]|uniref:TIGR02594 family protein n=1 Tax=uncultured Sphingorhabdus sp. TaxID=1686106 RepID=UPI00262C6976|nr:TIGR02594 family protein [uncultured Sphingorhabdus sp.]HMS21513.1 TIGR02594 family protein [Sphingorhabdus sp.]
MTNLPKGYEWLRNIGQLPRTVSEGLAMLGVAEIVGKGSNRTIIAWRDELNHAGIKIVGYSDDDIPWCGLYAAIVTHRAGKHAVEGPLWARNWVKFGTATNEPSLGDILVFARKGGGHVGFYVAEDDGAYHVLGGNQSNRVSITRIAKDRCIAVRRPIYRNKPASVRPYKMKATGGLSVNEA